MSDGLSANQSRFIAWLIDPSPDKGSQAQFAKRIGVDPTTLTKWKKDAAFRVEWERRHDEVAGGIARIAPLYERLYDIALNGDRLAIMNYLEVTGRYAPKKTLEIKDPRLASTDDKELLAEIRRMEQKLKAGGKLQVLDGGMAAPPKRRGRPPKAG